MASATSEEGSVVLAPGDRCARCDHFDVRGYDLGYGICWCPQMETEWGTGPWVGTRSPPCEFFVVADKRELAARRRDEVADWSDD